MSRAPIGIFDSGFGGLTVMNAVRRELPRENIIYFGDTANLPYGNKSRESISEICQKNTEFLLALGIKFLIVACHTACTAAYQEIQNVCSVPLLGMIGPGLDLVRTHSKTGHIALLGTIGTVRSRVYQNLIKDSISNAEVTAIPCPLFVPIVEEGYADHPIADLIADEYLRPLRQHSPETVLLACTHYPLLIRSVRKVLPPDTTILDPATECAEQVRALLSGHNLLNEEDKEPESLFYVSEDAEKFRLFGKNFFPYRMERVIATRPACLT